jgi:hypothetical protein
MRRPGPSRLATALLAAASLLLVASAWPQAPVVQLKAAYTLNFAKFTEWPAAQTSGPLRACVAGRSLVGQVLEQSVPTQVAGRRLEVHYVRLPGDVSGCDLLYISELDPNRGRRLLAAMADLPILTVSDIEGFTRMGGMIELLVAQRKLRFEIDLAAVRAAGLRLDPRLLELARRVHGQTNKGGH